MSAPASGFRGTQVFNSFGYDNNFDPGNEIPGSLIGSSCFTKGFTAPAAGYWTFTATRPAGGTVALGVFRKKAGSGSINWWTDLDLVSESSGSGSVSVTVYANAGDQLVAAADSVASLVDELFISNPTNGTVATPVGAKVIYSGIDHFQPTCGTSGATILYKQSGSSTWIVYSGPVSMAGIPDKTYFDIAALKADYTKSSIASWRYMAT